MSLASFQQELEEQVNLRFFQFGNADVHGRCSVCPGHENHDTLMDKVARSTFCLILPGDTQSR